MGQGRLCDAVLIDGNAATFLFQDPDIPMLDAVVQRAKAGHVSAVYVEGEAVFADGRFTRINRDEVLGEIAAQLAKPRSAEEIARRELRLAVFPHVRKFQEGQLDGTARIPFYAVSS